MNRTLACKFIRENTHLTTRQIATALDVDVTSVTRLIREYNLPKNIGARKPLSCREPLFSVLLSLDKKRIPHTLIAQELGISKNLFSSWRIGVREPRLIQFVCLCALAGKNITLEDI